MNSKMMKITKTADDQATSAGIVASIDDLLIQFLLHLPIKALLCFKVVSKHWLSLITTPKFSLLRNPNPNPAIGMFLPSAAKSRTNSRFRYVHFDTKNSCNPPFEQLEFTKDPSDLCIMQSCNGFLLCSNFQAQYQAQDSIRRYYVYNPTTKQYTTLPNLSSGNSISRTIKCMLLAFEPSKSLHYKVVCVRSSDLTPNHNQIEIYSSDFGIWRISGEPFSADIEFENGIYWNGSIHWFNTWLYSTLSYDTDYREYCKTTVYYNIDHERLGRIPMLPGGDGIEEARFVYYFGESCDHLHLIKRSIDEIQFNVYEMKRDFSGWFVKYKLDLTPITIDIPEMVAYYAIFKYYIISIFTLVRGSGDADEDSFLVLQIHGKAIRYNITSNTFENLCDIDGFEIEDSWDWSTRRAAEYIETLCCV